MINAKTAFITLMRGKAAVVFKKKKLRCGRATIVKQSQNVAAVSAELPECTSPSCTRVVPSPSFRPPYFSHSMSHSCPHLGLVVYLAPI